jgi:hypothetical protein
MDFALLGIVFGVLAAVTLLVLAAVRAGRQAELRRAMTRRAVDEIARSIDKPLDACPQAAIVETVLVSAVEDAAVNAVVRDLRGMWPTPAARNVDELPADEPLRPVDELVRLLDANTRKVAAVEQVLLNLLSPADPDTAALSAAMQHLGGVLPESLHAIGTDLIGYAHSAQFGTDFDALVGDVMRGVALNAVEQAGPAGEAAAGALHTIEQTGAAAEAFGTEGLAGAVTVLAEGMLPEGVPSALKMVADAVQSPDMADAVQHAGSLTTAVEGVSAADGVSAHLPFVTALISIHREITLLERDETSIDHSLKNVALDVTGTGVGSAAGAKVGAIIGSFFGPGPGTAIGAAAGAVVGAIAGRTLSNQVKTAGLREAQAAFEREREEAPRRIGELQIELREAATDRAQEEGQRFDGALGTPPSLSVGRETEWRELTRMLRVAARTELEGARSLVASAAGYAVYDRGLAGGLAVIEPALARTEAALRESEARETAGDYRSSLLSVATVPLRLPFDACINQEEVLRELVDEHRVAVANWTRAAAASFRHHAEILADGIAADCRGYQRDHRNVVGALEAALVRVVEEQRRLGVT